MYEETTYEVILQRMLDRVSDRLDKREGSVIWDALAPTAIEHQLLYIAIDTILQEVFADTATREYLIKRAAEIDITPHEATPAVWEVRFTPAGMTIPIGARFNCDSMNLYVSSKIEDGLYELTCETPGLAGNNCMSIGTLLPINYLRGLEKAEFVGLVTAGTDEEDTEEFRTRYLTKIRTPASSGNVYDYQNWALEVNGVGGVKVLPLANGPGTVELCIVDDDQKAATPALINSVREYIETVRPIGPTVTIISATEVAINIAATIKIKDSADIATVTTKFTSAVQEYLDENAFSTSYISIAMIGNLLINTPGVEDYSNLKLNELSENVTITNLQVAVLGVIALEVNNS